MKDYNIKNTEEIRDVFTTQVSPDFNPYAVLDRVDLPELKIKQSPMSPVAARKVRIANITNG